jgi:uncharacterized protein (DUF433 family)
MLSWSHFEHANLGGAKLTNGSLDNCSFNAAFMRGVVLKNARLDSANFEKAQLFDTDLRGVVFKNCTLTGANLTKADLRGTDLSAAIGLTREQIDSARIDETTRLPDYLGGIAISSEIRTELLSDDEKLRRITNEQSKQPTIRDLNVHVAFVLQLLALNMSWERVIEFHPGVDRVDIEACLLYAAKVAGHPFLARSPDSEKGPSPD